MPERIRGVPPDPWAGDADAGREALNGNYTLFGRTRHLGDIPWKNRTLSDQERQALHRFDFLGDLAALGTGEALDKGCDLIARWTNEYGQWQPLIWEPGITGRRLTNWLRTFGFLHNPNHPGFNLTFLESATVQVRHLARTVEETPPDALAIEAAEGLVLGSLCLAGMETLLDTALVALEFAIKHQVLPDGGHFQRNPAIQRQVLARLVRVRDTLNAAQITTPVWLDNAIARMAPMLRAMRHGDGGLALFNGSTEGHTDAIDKILLAAGGDDKCLMSAPHTGFQRAEARGSVLIADAGAAVVSGANRDAHAGLLAFEFSDREQRVFVNCGAHGNRGDDWHTALRATAAHSTLVIDNTNAVEVLASGGLGHLDTAVTCHRSETEGSTFLQMRHDGYRRIFGLSHGRELYLSASGDDLRGRDTLKIAHDYMGNHARRFCVRFHLHPDINAEETGGGHSVMLKMPDRTGWRFRASGGDIALEDSVYLGVPGTMRRTRQITVAGPLNAHGIEVKWSLIREGTRS